MRKSTGLVVIGLLLATIGAGVSAYSTGDLLNDTAISSEETTATPPQTTDSPEPNVSKGPDRRNQFSNNTTVTAATTEERASYTVVLTTTDNLDAHTATLEAHGAEIQSQFERRLLITLPRHNRTAVHQLPWVETIHQPIEAQPASINASTSMNATDLKASGVTGDGVKVGVIDAGFDSSVSTLADQVAATKTFTTAGATAHGTAVAEVVSNVAPNASLYLASTGLNGGVPFANAVDWLANGQNVDVIVYSAGTLIAPDDGSSFAAQQVTAAVESNTTFVVAAGNSGQIHWRGSYTDTDADNWHEFTTSDETNRFTLDTSSQVAISIDWQDWPTSANDYDLYLFEATLFGDDPMIARSTRVQNGDSAPYEVLSGTLPAGSYYVMVRNYDADGTAAIDMYCRGCNQLEHRQAFHSISSPATAEAATTVGAYNIDTNELELYSSQGPTADGRHGIDIIGPTRLDTLTYSPFAGTSAAAPAVAGGIALLEAHGNGIDVAAASQALTATTIGQSDGVSPATGYGAVDIGAAAQQLETQPTPTIAPVNVTNAVLTPDSVTGNTSNEHTLTFDLLNVSDDANTDTLTVTVPANTLGNATVNQITDANGNAVPVDSISVSGDTATLRISPASSVDFRDLTVTLDLMITTPAVTDIVNGEITITAVDSTNGEDSTTTTLTIQPTGAAPAIVGDTPAQDLNNDGTFEDVNGDGTFNIVDVNAFFQNYQSSAVQENSGLFDYNGDGTVNIVDVNLLFQNSQA